MIDAPADVEVDHAVCPAGASPENLVTCWRSLTLYVPKCSTTHGKLASLPTATVTLGMGCANLGSSIITVEGKEGNREGVDQ